MIVKDEWGNADFKDMGWHDCRLYAFSIPNEEFELVLDIDYIFKWPREERGEKGYWVSPCDLKFNGVSNLKIDMDFKDNMLLFIVDLKRFNQGLSPNGKFTVWDFEVECDNGTISFNSTGFNQIIRNQPILSEAQDLDLNRWR